MSLSVPSSRLVLDFRQPEDALEIEPLINILAWRGDPLLVPLSLWDEGEVADLATTASLTLLVKETSDSDDDTALMSDTKTVFTPDDGLGADSCCEFDFTTAECNLAASLWKDGAEKIELFVYLFAIGDDGEKREIARGKLVMYWDGNPTGAGSPDANPGIVLINKRGTIDLGNGVTSGTLTFDSAFDAAPSQVFLTVEMPNATGALIFALPRSRLAASFVWELSGPTPDANHKLHWLALA